MTNPKNWKIEYDIPDIPRSFLDAGFPVLLSYILLSRGYDTVEKAREMIEGRSGSLNDPFLIRDMDRAVARIKKAIADGEKVAVFGDYDVDGITATCLLSDYLSSRGLQCVKYIPKRDEGYGLNAEALAGFVPQGVSLVITVDCGITAREEAAYAASIGLDMIITDHHECDLFGIPEAVAVLDCKRRDDTYPNKNLAGVGMAFKLVSALEGSQSAALDRYSDLVALGTVADVMPLDVFENRYLVRRGLEELRSNPRIGINALLKSAGADPRTIGVSTIGFVIAPRLNAAGRMDCADTALNLLMSRNEAEAAALAEKLQDLNVQRQNEEKRIWDDVTRKLSDSHADLTVPLVLDDTEDNWKPGVIGIAASRLAEQYSVPVIMICLSQNDGDGIGKGSCRTAPGFNLYEALTYLKDYLVTYGGHPQAAGLKIKRDMIPSFRQALTEYYLSHKTSSEPSLSCDFLVTDPSLLSIGNVEALDLLEPFGNSNAKPVLCIMGAVIVRMSEINEKHTKMNLIFRGVQYDGIFFGKRLSDLDVRVGSTVDIAFTPQINLFKGNKTVQLTLCAVRPHESDAICEDIRNGCRYTRAAMQYLPQRPDFEKVWRFNRSSITSCPDGIMMETYSICLKVFEQCGLIDSNAVKIQTDGKRDLFATELMKKLNGSR